MSEIAPEAASTLKPPDDAHARMVCKIGEGAMCCRYLTMSPGGWSCEKHGPLRSHLDWRAATGQMVARSDNCEGKGSR